MFKRIKNKKGFTIIEIMVVIALIGILAAVLVPKFGGVKDTARNTGMLTNVKMVETYVASIIDDWNAEDAVGDTAGTDDLIAAIEDYFADTDNLLTNPYTGEADDANIVVGAGTDFSIGETDATDAGIVYVVVDADTAGEPLTVYINSFDSKGILLKNSGRTVVR